MKCEYSIKSLLKEGFFVIFPDHFASFAMTKKSLKALKTQLCLSIRIPNHLVSNLQPILSITAQMSPLKPILSSIDSNWQQPRRKFSPFHAFVSQALRPNANSKSKFKVAWIIESRLFIHKIFRRYGLETDWRFCSNFSSWFLSTKCWKTISCKISKSLYLVATFNHQIAKVEKYLFFCYVPPRSSGKRVFSCQLLCYQNSFAW